MLDLFIFILATFSMTSIIVDQLIFEEVRGIIFKWAESKPSKLALKLTQLIRCHFCTGFWSGVLITGFLLNPFNITFLDPILGGLVSAATSYYLNIASEFLIQYAEESGLEV